ncbi:hypothetical protein D3C79_959360 [compost metagenome]
MSAVSAIRGGLYRRVGRLPHKVWFFMGEAALPTIRRLQSEGLNSRVQRTAELEQLLTLLTPFTNTLEVVFSQVMNPLTVVTNLAHGAALLRRDVGNSYRGSRNGLD